VPAHAKIHHATVDQMKAIFQFSGLF